MDPFAPDVVRGDHVSTLVTDSDGPTEGAEKDAEQEVGGVARFHGIPFAAPCVGEWRWRKPREATPWAPEVLDSHLRYAVLLAPS